MKLKIFLLLCRDLEEFKQFNSILQEDNLPYSRSTYLIDPPTSFEQQQQRYSNTFSNGSSSVVRAFAPVEDPMSLYSVVHKDRKILQSNQSDSPCSIEHQTMNYEGDSNLWMNLMAEISMLKAGSRVEQ